MKIEHKPLFTSYELSEKEKKSLTILELIRKKDLISRTEISKDTGINIVSVSNYITSFIEKNLLSEKGLAVSSGGRKPELVELNRKSNHIIGLDINGNRIKVLLADIGLKVLDEEEADVSSQKNGQEGLLGLIETVLKKSGVSKNDIKAIGIAIPSSDLSIAKSIEKEFGVETFAGGCAFSAAFAEKRLNPDADVENLLYIYSDLGCGVVIKNEELIEESKYLQPWNDMFGVAGFAKKEVNRGVGTTIVDFAKGDVKNITSDIVIEAAKEGDRVALDIVETVGINLGIRIAYLVNIFDPEVVAIGGNIVKAGEFVLKPVKNMVRKLALRSRSKVRIVPSVLGEDCVVLGAATLAIREIFLKA